MNQPASQPETPTDTARRTPRRHDLDALRAIAMLLGIVIHVALSFVPMPSEGWFVHDSRSNSGFAVVLSVIHGFRMPLFFLLSGFFTAMLWRNRGLRALLVHRAKRILLPLLVGTLTIVPLVWIVGLTAATTANPQTDQPISLWDAVARDDGDAFEDRLREVDDINATQPIRGETALSLASKHGRTAIAKQLLDAGADPNARNRDGSTAFHGAALFGRVDVARLLLDRGASSQARNRLGQRPGDLMKVNPDTTEFIASMVGVNNLVKGALLEQRGEILEMTGNPERVELPAEKASAAEQLSGLVMLLSMIPVFHHLWFLHFLCCLVVAFAVYAFVADRLPWRLPSWLVTSPVRYAYLIPLTFLCQSLMGQMYPNFGPDTSGGLLPMPQILAYYAIFFFFGAIYYDSHDETHRAGRFWPLTLPLALLVVFPIGYEMVYGATGYLDGWLDSPYFRPLAVFCQVLYVWLASFGLMGLFRSCFSSQSRTMRYLSDSSYWLYLAHLPLVIVAQMLVRDWPLPALLKFSLICLVSTALLLASYQLFVRYTIIGKMLNGPRTRDSRRSAPSGDAVTGALVDGGVSARS